MVINGPYRALKSVFSDFSPRLHNRRGVHSGMIGRRQPTIEPTNFPPKWRAQIRQAAHPIRAT
jgi:hypothetical protein